MLQHKIYNIPAGQPFARLLAQWLLDEVHGAPESLTRYKILLPTRRACRVLRDAFLALGEGKPLLLPQMTPLGDVEEEDLSLLMYGQMAGFLDIPPAIAPLARQLKLARLIMAHPDYAQGYEHALCLAQDLGRFLDQVEIEGLDFANLQNIVPDEFAAHWKITLGFLDIITQNWPKILAEEGLIDGAVRRNRLLEALADYWQAVTPDTPIIAAGTTGSIPATAKLLRVIASLPQGRIVLPGLDQGMDEISWDCAGETHPQYGLKKLLQHLEVNRADVMLFPKAQGTRPRLTLAGQVMRPAETTLAWQEFTTQKDILPPMLEGLSFYALQTQQEEAQVIALMLREVLEDPQKTAALITPDRTLARRVSALCRRWGVDVDDSAGQALRESMLGRFAMLCLKAGLERFDAVVFLALLKHPLCGMAAQNPDALVFIEKEILRTDDIISDYKTVQQKYEEKRQDGFMEQFCTAIEDLAVLREFKETIAFSDLLQAHLQVMENLAAAPLWRGDMGEAGARFLTDLSQQASQIPPVSTEDYTGILSNLMGNVVVRTPHGVHPRLLILGQLEARMTCADLIILGGLNEGGWPPDIGHDPWLSRPMRKNFGLPAPERSIGLAAHDFVQGFCAENVVLTRALRVDGAPSVPARWVQRLETVLQGFGVDMASLARVDYQGWARFMDVHDAPLSCKRPAPRPPITVRPQGISITRVENWIKDPYMIYARYILKLEKLKPLRQDFDAALRGTILHKILEIFCRTHPVSLPEDCVGELVKIARLTLAARLESEDAARYWWPRFIRIAQWFSAQEIQWRTRAKFLGTELRGEIDLPVDGQNFKLYGVADRIDRMAGGYGVIDYKSGGSFSAAGIRAASLPQLPLAGLMVEQGGFKASHVAPAPVQYLGYWKMTGGNDSGSEVGIEDDLEGAISTARTGLEGLVRLFRDPQTPYYCIPDMNNAPRFNDYEHLERIKEWAVLDDPASEWEDAA